MQRFCAASCALKSLSCCSSSPQLPRGPRRSSQGRHGASTLPHTKLAQVPSALRHGVLMCPVHHRKVERGSPRNSQPPQCYDGTSQSSTFPAQSAPPRRTIEETLAYGPHHQKSDSSRNAVVLYNGKICFSHSVTIARARLVINEPPVGVFFYAEPLSCAEEPCACVGQTSDAPRSPPCGVFSCFDFVNVTLSRCTVS